MSFKEGLNWLKGKRVVVADANLERAQTLNTFLQNYGLQVTLLTSMDEVKHEIERRHYATHRVYLAVLVEMSLAQQVESVWQKVTQDNPLILQTPVVLMRTQQEAQSHQAWIEQGYFRYQLDQPVSPQQMLRLLRRLNRWKKLQAELQKEPKASAVLGD